MLNQAREMREALVGQMTSIANEKDMAAMLYRMQGHYWMQGMTQGQMQAVASDYIRLLGGFPKAVWVQVCDVILLDDSVKFFPKIADFKKRLQSVKLSVEGTIAKLDKLIAEAEKPVA